MAIITVLLTLVLAAVRGTLGVAQSLVCQQRAGTVCFDFTTFADDQLHETRGMDARYLGGRFRLITFINGQFRLGEFWAQGQGIDRVPLPDDHPMQCPAAERGMAVTDTGDAITGGIATPQLLSIGVNRRLYQPETPRPGRLEIQLRSTILIEQNIPLIWDIDGASAFDSGLENDAVLSAPSLGARGPIANNRYWHPSFRHGGRMNVGFVGGHVLSSKRPLEQSGWRWSFWPRP